MKTATKKSIVSQEDGEEADDPFQDQDGEEDDDSVQEQDEGSMGDKKKARTAIKMTNEEKEMAIELRVRGRGWSEIAQILKFQFDLDTIYPAWKLRRTLSRSLQSRRSQEMERAAEDRVTRQLEEAQIDPLDRLFDGPYMQRVEDTEELLQVYRDAEGPTNRTLAVRPWHEEVAHIFLDRLTRMHASQYAKFFKVISNAVKDSANCFVFLKQLDPNMSYKITCYSKSSKSSFEFRNIDGLLCNTIPDEDQESRKYHITFMGDGEVPSMGKVDVSELARKYIRRRKMSEPKGQDEEREPESDGEQRGKKRRMLNKEAEQLSGLNSTT